MGLFDIFKKGKSEKELLFENIHKKMFPNGDKDIDAGANEVRMIFGENIPVEYAKRIFLKTTFLIFTSNKYSEEMLLSYFQREVNVDFHKKQIERYYGYLLAIKIANSTHNVGASEIKLNKSEYYW